MGGWVVDGDGDVLVGTRSIMAFDAPTENEIRVVSLLNQLPEVINWTIS